MQQALPKEVRKELTLRFPQRRQKKGIYKTRIHKIYRGGHQRIKRVA